jgi:hypothetical protein
MPTSIAIDEALPAEAMAATEVAPTATGSWSRVAAPVDGHRQSSQIAQ